MPPPNPSSSGQPISVVVAYPWGKKLLRICIKFVYQTVFDPLHIWSKYLEQNVLDMSNPSVAPRSDLCPLQCLWPCLWCSVRSVVWLQPRCTVSSAQQVSVKTASASCMLPPTTFADTPMSPSPRPAPRLHPAACTLRNCSDTTAWRTGRWCVGGVPWSSTRTTPHSHSHKP